MRRLAIDLAIAVVLLAGSGGWATRFWNAWIAAGGQPSFYQNYFEPAVMVACGKGFVVSQGPRLPVLEDFLNRRRDAMACSELPADLPVGKNGLSTGAWIYLQTTVGWAWRVLGISWSRMGPLFGLLFGIVVATAYGIFRLGMNRWLALAGAFGLTISSSHLGNLPHLRDYAKAPFTLALVLILGLLVTRPIRPRVLLTLALAYGLVLGIGYGFRTDFLINVPLFVIVVFGFLEGGVTRDLVLKTAATLLFLATFIVVSWPVTSAVYKEGGCQWHVALLGMQSPLDESLGMSPAPYEFGYAYADEYVIKGVQGFAFRTQPQAPLPVYCSHEYDVQSGRLLNAIVTSFPADFIARAYASVLQIAELPFVSLASPLEGWASRLYDIRSDVLQPKIGWGFYLDVAAILVAAVASLRLGLFLLFFAAYFGGYPAIQFQDRHHFHLEFMTWWAGGFLLQQVIMAAWSLRRGLPAWPPVLHAAERVAVFAVAAVVVIAGVLIAARRYQQHEATSLFASYAAAARSELEPTATVLPDVSPRAWPQYLEVDLDQRRCGPGPSVTFRNGPDTADGDLTRTVTVEHRSSAPGVTRILMPVFFPFRGLEFSDSRPGCVAGVFRLTDLQRFPLLLGAVLPPDWQSLPLHQRIRDWDRDPFDRQFVAAPRLSSWTSGAITRRSRSLLGALDIVGDRSATGYQLTSPRLTAPAGARVFVRTNLTASHGRVCLGALDGAGLKWLLPANAVRRDMLLTIDQTGGFMLAVANCNPAEIRSPSRFSISSASYAVE